MYEKTVTCERGYDRSDAGNTHKDAYTLPIPEPATPALLAVGRGIYCGIVAARATVRMSSLLMTERESWTRREQ